MIIGKIMSEDSYNFNANNQFNQVGDGNVQHNKPSQTKVVTPQEFLEYLDTEVKSKQLSWNDLGNPQELAVTYDTPQEFLKEAKEEASKPPVFASNNEVELEKVEWYEKFKTFLPHFVKGASEVGLAIAKTYTDSSPVIAGFIAAFDYIKKNS